MRRVQALMDRADHPNANEHERDACIAKADSLMQAYAIEQFELDMARPANQREKPEVRFFTMADSGDWDLDWEYRQLFIRMTRHVGGMYVDQRSEGHRVIGFPSDLDWLDWLYQSVRLHMLNTMQPKATTDLSVEENIALLKETGLKWQDVWERMVKVFPDDPHFAKQLATNAEMVDFYKRADDRYPGSDPHQLYIFTDRYLKVGPKIFHKKVTKSVGVWFTKVYTDHCKRNGFDRTYASPTVYRRSFMDGYFYRINQRLDEMKRARGEAAVGKELVLANKEGDLKELLWELRPELRPHPEDCDCDQCHRCADPKCNRYRCKNARTPVKRTRVARYTEPKYDAAASRAGSRAANSADLMGGRHNVGSNKRELD